MTRVCAAMTRICSRAQRVDSLLAQHARTCAETRASISAGLHYITSTALQMHQKPAPEGPQLFVALAIYAVRKINVAAHSSKLLSSVVQLQGSSFALVWHTLSIVLTKASWMHAGQARPLQAVLHGASAKQQRCWGILNATSFLMLKRAALSLRLRHCRLRAF